MSPKTPLLFFIALPLISGCSILPAQNYKINETNEIISHYALNAKINSELQWRTQCWILGTQRSELKIKAIEMLKGASKEDRYLTYLALDSTFGSKSEFKDIEFMRAAFKQEYEEFKDRCELKSK